MGYKEADIISVFSIRIICVSSKVYMIHITLYYVYLYVTLMGL